MNKIFKYPLDRTAESQIIKLHEGAQILTVQVQKGDLVLWALCNEKKKKEPRQIDIYGTGAEMSEHKRTYIGTVQQFGGVLILHVFERI